MPKPLRHDRMLPTRIFQHLQFFRQILNFWCTSHGFLVEWQPVADMVMIKPYCRHQCPHSGWTVPLWPPSSPVCLFPAPEWCICCSSNQVGCLTHTDHCRPLAYQRVLKPMDRNNGTLFLMIVHQHVVFRIEAITAPRKSCTSLGFSVLPNRSVNHIDVPIHSFHPFHLICMYKISCLLQKQDLAQIKIKSVERKSSA